MYSDSYDNEAYVPEDINDVEVLQSKPEGEDRGRLCDKGGISCAWRELAGRIQRHNG